ncbi:MAG: lipoyl(octanoyl) transferase LipB [Planctomycetota bacterium]|nr:lipoyl(octanoyl) transferase LipB [Planctomycetota bacterium]
MLRIHDLGTLAYSRTTPQQVALKDAVRASRHEDDFLIFVEHEPVITLGRSWEGGNLLLSEDKYRELGFEVHKVSRGGDVTYHGPGQLVAYPVFHLSRHGKDIHKFLSNLEEVSIRVLASYGLPGERKEGMTGAWSKGRKVCAIGVAISGWVSYHGLAFNVNPDMKHFGLIVPCGIREYPVGSLSELVGKDVPMSEVRERFIDSFKEVFAQTEHTYTNDTETGKLSCLDEEGHISV